MGRVENNIRKIIMSREVALTFLNKVAKVTSTVTIYFNNTEGVKGFSRSVKAAHGTAVSCVQGLDYLIVMASPDIIEGLKDTALQQNLDFSE